MSKSFFCTQPPSRTNVLATFRCFFSPVSQRPFTQQRQGQLHPNTVLQFFILFLLLLSCPLLPIKFSGLLQEHFLHVFWANVRHVNASVAFEYQGVPQGPLDTQITGPRHHCSCKSSYLPPRLNFSNLFHPSFSLLLIPFSRPDCFCPILCGQNREIFPTTRPKASMKKGQRGRPLFANCCCHLSPQF